jgi:Zn-dependent M28 family amino/carboxypeptidase
MRKMMPPALKGAEKIQIQPINLRFLNSYVLVLLFLPLGKGLFSQTPDTNAMKFAKTITAEDAKKHLSVLASDEYEGRETGKEGQRKAAKYIAESFKASGLKSATDESYLQKVPLLLSTPGESKIEVGGKKYVHLADFYFFPFGEDLKLEAKNFLFLGYGISEKFEKGEKPEGAIAYDDYNDIDVKGKVLMVLAGEPRNEDSISFLTGKEEASKWSTNSRKKISFAKSKGALGLIVVSSDFESNIELIKEYLESPSLNLEPDPNVKKEEGAEEKNIPQAGISAKMANEILLAQKATIENIKKKIQTTKLPFTFDINLPVILAITNKAEKISSENVIGVVEGKELKDEVIFITAHYDHLGVQDGKIYNGADDDGSGTVGVMEMAEAFAKAKAAGFGPKRTLVFMTVTGEEKGLLGSSYYTDHPIFPIANTVCDLNIDMIGRFDEKHAKDSSFVYLIGSDKISTDLHKINEEANNTYTKLALDYTYNDPDDPNRFYYRSDHYNFAEKGVPIIFYFNGVHDDYHKDTDDISKINFDLLVKRTQLVFYTTWEVANRDARIKSDVPQEKKK